MLEDTAGQISGVTKQREGAVGQYEYVGNVQRSVVQSATITESWFHAHKEVKKKVYGRAVELMKMCWSEGKKASLILGDGASKILSVMPDIALNDYAIFVGDSGKDDAIRQSVTQLSQAALQSGQVSLLDVIRVLKADTATEAERVLEMGMEAIKNQQADAQQQQQQVMQMQQQAEAAKFEKEAALKKMDNDTKIQVANIQSQADIKVAEIADMSKRDIADMKEKVALGKEGAETEPNTETRAEAFEKVKEKVTE